MAQVSVIIPAYNAGKTIGVAINSVRMQTLSDLEIIVCDDASSDNTCKVLSQIDDRRLHILRNTENLGPGASRDRAIGKAKAPWIALIDADDAWQPNRLERLLETVGSDQNILAFDDVMICHDSEGTLVPWRPIHGRFAFGADGFNNRDVPLEDYVRSERLLIKAMMPARVIREHNIRHSDRRFGEDAEFYIRLGLTGIKMRYLPEPMYFYRITPNSLTSVARDQTLMRRCLEGCAQIDGLPESVQIALEEKIKALRTNEVLYDLAEQFSRGNLIRILQLLIKEPQVIQILPRRLLRHLSYRIDRKRHRCYSR